MDSPASKHEYLEMAQAIDLLVEFAEAYSLAQQTGQDTETQDLRLSTQMLLALLTNKAAKPLDVEEVFPHDELIADA